MARLDANRRAELWALVAGQVVSLLLLAGCAWWVYRELSIVIGGSRLTDSITWGDHFNATLRGQLAWFALAVLALHVVLGLLGSALARLTRAAFPNMPAKHYTPVTIGWIVMIFAFALLANSSWYPASRFAGGSLRLPADWFGLAPLTVLTAAVLLAILLLVALAIRRAAAPAQSLKRSSFALAVLAAAVTVGSIADDSAGAAAPARATKTHIVIIGIDSMRNDLSEPAAGAVLTPNVDTFLAGSIRFEDATTPLARSYPAWLAILTGRHPVRTNARFNLMPRALVQEGNTLAEALVAAGYRSVFAADEVRFANFDRSYGFDQLITPPIGASDFVVPTIGEMPLVNVVGGSRIGARLFPNIHANRAAAVTYDPAAFIRRLDRELAVQGPSFLAIHLTLAHWPYSWAGLPKPTTPQEFRPAYRKALQQVDRQFQDLLALLERKGVLANAIVVVLSDHGEALGYQSDSMLRRTGSSGEIWDSLWGHGTSVLSPHQYGVLFAMRAFGNARLPGEPGSRRWPVTLEDVRPTLEELAIGTASRDVDGSSLAPFLAGLAPVSILEARVRFTETCFNTVKLMEGKFTESGLVSEAGIYYEVVPDTGWVQLRPDRLPEIMAKKQRAALSSDALLAAVPNWTDDSVAYLFSSRRDPLPRRLAGPPNPVTDPEAARLWAALHERFAGELPGGP
ncbi:MAG: sulfatase-like hydrolase/transferase [Gammaproteobacteria bacterium]